MTIINHKVMSDRKVRRSACHRAVGHRAGCAENNESPPNGRIGLGGHPAIGWGGLVISENVYGVDLWAYDLLISCADIAFLFRPLQSKPGVCRFSLYPHRKKKLPQRRKNNPGFPPEDVNRVAVSS